MESNNAEQMCVISPYRSCHRYRQSLESRCTREIAALSERERVRDREQVLLPPISVIYCKGVHASVQGKGHTRLQRDLSSLATCHNFI